MEDLINVQLAQKELLENCVTNYKKAGKDERTKKFYLKRLATLQEYWDVFVAGQKALLTKRIAEKGAQKRFDYFEEDIFSEVENYFYANYELIQDRYEKEFVGDTALDQSQSMAQSSTSGNKIECSLQLPKISLEKFDGDYKKWPTFHDLFRTMVHQNDSLGPVQKLQYLKMHLTGEPEHLLRHYQVTEKNYFSAWATLQERYDNRRVLVSTQLKMLLFQTKVQQESAQCIRNLLDTTSECLHALENLDIPTGEWDPILVFLIVHKLPSETHELWEREINKMKELPVWNTLKEFLKSRFRTLEAINYRKPSQKPQSPSTNSNYIKNKPIVQSFQVTATPVATPVCIVCQGQHQIRKCEKFTKLNQAKRLEIVKTRRLCINCLGSGHRMNKCPSTRSCFHCKKKHHTLLHKNTDSSQNNNNNNQPRNQSSSNFPTNNQIATNHILSPDTTNFVPSQIKSFERQELQTKSNLSSGIDSIDGQMDAKIKEFERQIRVLKQEKEYLAKEKSDALERLKSQDVELNDALSQRKLAMTEYSEVTNKLSELRSQKQKLSQQVRDKEEELETAMQKIDNLRNDLRKADKNRCGMESRIEDVIAEATKERKLRERSEEYCRQLQAEVRTRSTSDLGSSSSLGGISSRASRLEIGRIEVQFSEKLNQQQSRFNLELASLPEQLNEAEKHRDLLYRELQQACEKCDTSRLESLIATEETISELKKRYEREKTLWVDEKRKLLSENELVKILIRWRKHRIAFTADIEKKNRHREPSLLDLKRNRLNRWQHLQHLFQSFWRRWNTEYLSRLQQRPKWTKQIKNVEVGDLVILKEENLPPCRWLLARIIETHPGKDGLVRVVTVKTKASTFKRPIAKICILPLPTHTSTTHRESATISLIEK